VTRMHAHSCVCRIHAHSCVCVDCVHTHTPVCREFHPHNKFHPRSCVCQMHAQKCVCVDGVDEILCFCHDRNREFQWSLECTHTLVCEEWIVWMKFFASFSIETENFMHTQIRMHAHCVVCVESTYTFVCVFVHT